MKVIPLIDYATSNDQLHAEHGLSLYIETGKYKILFDTGQSDALIHNASVLGIDLEAINMVVISHGHYDHVGGLTSFLKINKQAKVFLKREVLTKKFYTINKGVKKYAGCKEDLSIYSDRFVFLNVGLYMVDNLTFMSSIDLVYPSPKGNNRLYTDKDGEMVPDDFNHELVFTITIGEKVHIFCGCAHCGVLNTVVTTQRFITGKEISSIIGGFHLVSENENGEVEADHNVRFIGEELLRLTDKAIFYTGHCTSKKAEGILSSMLGNQLNKLVVGQELCLV